MRNNSEQAIDPPNVACLKSNVGQHLDEDYHTVFYGDTGVRGGAMRTVPPTSTHGDRDVQVGKNEDA
jgi:hypothetical protein